MPKRLLNIRMYRSKSKSEIAIGQQIAHSSKTLNPTQQRYNPSILEVLAVVSSLSTFQQILNNALVNVITDNPTTQRVLQTTDSLTKPNASRIKKWIVIIETFQVRIFLLKKTDESHIGKDQKPLTNTNTLTPNKIGELYTDKAITTPKKIMETNKAQRQTPDLSIRTNPEQSVKPPNKPTINEIKQEQRPTKPHTKHRRNARQGNRTSPPPPPPPQELTETKQKNRKPRKKKKKQNQTDNTIDIEALELDRNSWPDRRCLYFYDSENPPPPHDFSAKKDPVNHEREIRWKREWAEYVAKQPEEEQKYLFHTTM